MLQVVRGAPHKRQSCAGKTCPGNQKLYGCECRCPQVLDCTNLSPNYTFNDHLCACQCRNIPKCPTRTRLNFLTCTCELSCPRDTNYTCPRGQIFDLDTCACFDPTDGLPQNPGDLVTRDTATCAIPPPPPPYPPPPPVQRECPLTCDNERQELDVEECECVCVTVLKAPCPSERENSKSGSKSGTGPGSKKGKGKSGSSSGSRGKRSHSRSSSDECEYDTTKSDSSKSDSSKSDSSKSGSSKSGSSKKSKRSKSDTSKSGSPPSGPVELTACPSGQLLDTSTCQCYWEGEL